MEIKTNIKDNKLLDEFSGKLLGGKIQIASNRGYPFNKKKKQQDAVGSAVINENIFLNIVADGVGGSENGEFASRYVVEEMIKWFIEIEKDKFNDLENITNLLIKEIYGIGFDIYMLSEYDALTTFVLALTTQNQTIIANEGDSTVYSFNEKENKLQRLSTIDSWSGNLSYDEVRNHPFNNILTAYLGDRKGFTPNINVIDNEGQRLILSTDGVTDLVSEQRFISYFLNKYGAKEIVQDVLFNPEIDNVTKKEDNISAIVVDFSKSKVLKK